MKKKQVAAWDSNEFQASLDEAVKFAKGEKAKVKVESIYIPFARSRIMAAVHETARDLHDAGFISLHRMREFDALCLAPVPDCSGNEIQALRDRTEDAMANGAAKTEHAGAKKGAGAFYGKKTDAKKHSRRRRRQLDRKLEKGGFSKAPTIA